MVGGDQDQRVLAGGGLHCRPHGIRKRDGFIQRAVGVAVVVGHVDLRAFHHQHIAVGIAGQMGDRGAGHGGQAGFAAAGGDAVVVVLHVVVVEQAQHAGCAGRSRQSGGVGDVGPLRMVALPFGDQVAAVAAQAALAGLLRVALVAGQELLAATPQHDAGAVAGAAGFDQLQGDVLAACGHRRCRQRGVVFPAAIGNVRIGGGGSGVGDAGGADHAGGHAGGIGQFQPGLRMLAQAVGAVVFAAGIHRNGPHVGFHAGGDGAHGAGRIGGLRVGVVGFAEGGGGEGFPGEQMLFAAAAIALAFEDACGGHRGQAHAVAEEDDDVLRPPGHRAASGGLRGTVAVPPCGGFAAGVGHGGDIHVQCGGRRGGGQAGTGGQQGAAGQRQPAGKGRHDGHGVIMPAGHGGMRLRTGLP